MARAIWSGAVSFGMVNIPIRLYPAIESHRVAFHEFQKGTGQRIRNQHVAQDSGEEVPWEQIEKGFEVAKGRFVVLSDEELENAEPKRTRTIEIEQFVALSDIDPVAWDQTYYAAPDGEPSFKAYALLRKAMEAHQRVAIGRFVMRTKEYVVCIRPFDEILALQTMFFANEVRSAKKMGLLMPAVPVGSRELEMAKHLIDSLTAPWDPGAYEDTFSARVLALVRQKDKQKDKGKGPRITPAVDKAGAPKAEPVDLMAALKATLAAHPVAERTDSRRRRHPVPPSPSSRRTRKAPPPVRGAQTARNRKRRSS